MLKENELLVLLGAEGHAELEATPQPGVRNFEGTPAGVFDSVIDTFCDQAGIARSAYRNYLLDDAGRPYWLCSIDPAKAPDWIVRCDACAADEIRGLLNSPEWLRVRGVTPGDLPGETLEDTMRHELQALERK